jgi:WD40 repeat protein
MSVTGRAARQGALLSLRQDMQALLDGDRGTSPQDFVERLLGSGQLWWNACREAVKSDPSWLFEESAGQIREIVRAHAANGQMVDDSPYLTARALADHLDQLDKHVGPLRQVARQWEESGLLIPAEAQATAVPTSAARRGAPDLMKRLDTIQRLLRPSVGQVVHETDSARAMVLVTGLLLAGAEPRKRVVRVSIVFGLPDADGTEQGVTGVLELRELPGGPSGMFPDPRAMAGARSAGLGFRESLEHAWGLSIQKSAGRCVLWRIVLPEASSGPPLIRGGSLGAAFAVASRELFHYPASRRPGVMHLRRIFYGLRRRTAVTGVVEWDGGIHKVTNIGAKVEAARRKRWTLIAPKENEGEGRQAAPDPRMVKFAATVAQADRYAHQPRAGRIATASTVLAAVAVTGVVVSHQDAAAAARQQTAILLASASGSVLGNDVGLGELLAAQAYRELPDVQTRAALFAAVTASQHFVRSIQANGVISAVAASADGHVLVAGTKAGTVAEWSLSSADQVGRLREAARLDGAVTQVATDADGRVGAAISGDGVAVWPAEPGTARIHVPSGQQPAAVGVSPSGRYVLVATTVAGGELPPELLLFDRENGATAETAMRTAAFPSDIAVPSEDQAVVLDGAFGRWDRFAVPGLTHLAGSAVGFGAHDAAPSLSPNGEFFSTTNASTVLPVWRTSGKATLTTAPLEAQTLGNSPVATAVSSDGSMAAQAADNTVYVSKTAASGSTAGPPVALTGAGQVTTNGLTFVGNSNKRLISAAGDLLTLWDLGQYSRIATDESVPIPFSCDACTGPRIAPQPGGHYVAILNGNVISVVPDRPGASARYILQAPFLSAIADVAPLWAEDGQSLILVSWHDDSAVIRSFAPSLPVKGRWAAPPDPLQLSDAPTVLEFMPGSQEVAEIDGSGTVKIRDAATGRVLGQVQGPADMAPTADGGAQLPPRYAALSPQATYAAVVDNHSVRVTDISTGQTQVIHDGDPVGIAYAGNNLLIQLAGGSLEVWNASGITRTETLQGTPDIWAGPAVSGNVIAESGADGFVHLIDYPSGTQLGTIPFNSVQFAQWTSLAFSSDGNQLFVASSATGPNGAGQVADWEASPAAWLQTACESAGHDLTPAQWQQYTGITAPSNLQCAQRQ